MYRSLKFDAFLNLTLKQPLNPDENSPPKITYRYLVLSSTSFISSEQFRISILCISFTSENSPKNHTGPYVLALVAAIYPGISG